MYPASVNGIYEIQESFVNTSYPSSENIAKTLVTLPTHPMVNRSHRAILCARINEFPDLRYREKTGRPDH
jgi:dTDP-4-amino-4,6-dideoxygalactose transaminase